VSSTAVDDGDRRVTIDRASSIARCGSRRAEPGLRPPGVLRRPFKGPAAPAPATPTSLTSLTAPPEAPRS